MRSNFDLFFFSWERDWKLAQKIDIPIAFWDERLSTAAVTRTLIEADTRRDKRAEVVDKLAASYILQGALERLRPR